MDRQGFSRFEKRLLEFDGTRLEAMDKAGIELAVFSVTTPGVQTERDTRIAALVNKGRAVFGIAGYFACGS
jgi:hypothetical protein